MYYYSKMYSIHNNYSIAFKFVYKARNNVTGLAENTRLRPNAVLKSKNDCHFPDWHAFAKYFSKEILGVLNESHPRVFQAITLSFFIAFKARQS